MSFNCAQLSAVLFSSKREVQVTLFIRYTSPIDDTSYIYLPAILMVASQPRRRPAPRKALCLHTVTETPRKSLSWKHFEPVDWLWFGTDEPTMNEQTEFQTFTDSVVRFVAVYRPGSDPVRLSLCAPYHICSRRTRHLAVFRLTDSLTNGLMRKPFNCQSASTCSVLDDSLLIAEFSVG